MPLTDTAIRNAKPKDRPYILNSAYKVEHYHCAPPAYLLKNIYSILDRLSHLNAVMQEIEEFFEVAGPRAQAQQSALSLSGAIIVAEVFSAVIIQAVEMLCTATALVSILSACGLACLQLVYVRYERDITHAYAQWEKRRRQWKSIISPQHI